MDAIAEVKVVAGSGLPVFNHVVVPLHHEVVPHFNNWQQALHARIHVAVEGVVL